MGQLGAVAVGQVLLPGQGVQVGAVGRGRQQVERSLRSPALELGSARVVDEAESCLAKLREIFEGRNAAAEPS